MGSIDTSVVVKPLRDFRRSWPQVVSTDLVSRIFGVVVLTPFLAVLLKLFLMGTEDGVLSDQEILVFLLHPLGMTALLLVLAVAVCMLFIETGQLMVIGLGSVEDRRVTYLDSLRYVLRHFAPLANLARHAVVRLLLLSAPFLAALALVYRLLLGDHDINFYLVHKPPEFWRAVAIGGVILAAMAAVVVRQFAAWLLGLPMVLFEGRGGKAALRASGEATAGMRGTLGLFLVAWLLGVRLLAALAAFVVSWLGGAAVQTFRGTSWIVVTMGAVLLASGLANLAVSVFANSVFPLVVVRLYRSLAGPGRLAPPLAPRGSLGSKPVIGLPDVAILAGAAVVFLAIVSGAGYVAEQVDEERSPAIIAHRGASGAAPENTMAAFERAIADGADWIELDVQENADGQVVVHHDSDFMKQAGVPLKVWDATAEELSDLDVGSWFAPEFAQERVPTLHEALELARGKVGVFIELKYYGHDEQLESRVVRTVEAEGMDSSVVIMSLKYAGVRKTAAIRPDWTYGLLTSVNVGDPTRLDVDFLAVNSSAATVDLVRRVHARGMKLYAWTVNDPVRMSVMLSRGVDGVITDDPALARAVVEFREDLTPVGRLLVWLAGEAGLFRSWEPPPRSDA